jgi:hypothetical protein
VIRVAASLLLLSACDVIDDVERTHFELGELMFQVEVEAGAPLERDRPDLEEEVSLADNVDVAGASALEEVRIEEILVVADQNTIGVGIERIEFLVAPITLETRTVFAAVSGLAANEADWPDPETFESGIDRLAEFVADQHSPFLVQAAITFDVPDGYQAGSAGLLDVRLRISASALAPR